MIALFRASSSQSRLMATLILLTCLMLTGTAAQAAVNMPIDNTGQGTEIVSGRTFSQLGPNGERVTVSDLAVSGQLLIQLWDTASRQQFDDMLLQMGSRVLHEYTTRGLFLISLPQGMSVNSGMSAMMAQRIVKSVCPDRLAYMDRTPNDPMYSQQWQWPKIKAPAAWDVQTGSATVVVGIVDSGVDLTHEDLAARIWRNTDEIAGNGLDDDGNGFIDDVNGWDFSNNNNDPNPGSGVFGSADDHGTHVAGLVGAIGDNGVGVSGHAWNCQLMAVQVFNNGSSSMSIIIAGFEYARDNGSQIINMSLGGGYTDLWTTPIADAHAKGISVVCAAGNESFGDAFRYFFTDNLSTWLSPVCNDGPNFMDNNVIGVGATDSNDVAAFFTCLDQSSRNFVDVMAPGVNIYSSLYYNPAMGFGSKYGQMSGTSMACPVAAGLVTVIKSQFPTMSPAAIAQQITLACENIDVANPINVGTMGAGRINSPNCLLDAAPSAARSVAAFDSPGDSGGSITVTWNVSLDDGRGYNDVTRYDILRAEVAEGPFTTLGTVAKGTKAYIDASATDYTDYYYEVVTFDAATPTVSKVAGPATSRDDTAPEAVTLTGGDTQGDLGGSISVSWGGYAAPSDFKEYRIYRLDSNFDDVSGMTPLKVVNSSSTKSYQDKLTTDDQDYYYAVTCVDNSQPSNEDTTVVTAGPLRSNPNYSFAFAPGLSLMSIGLELTETDPGAIMDLTHGSSLSRWDPTLPNPGTDVVGAYHQYLTDSSDAFLAQKPGRGYWLVASKPMVLNLSGAAATTETRIDFASGWNQLGNPYISDTDVLEARVVIGGTSYSLDQSNDRGWTRNYMWGYDSARKSYKLISADLPFSIPTIGKGEGFFFLGLRPGQLILKNPDLSTEAIASWPQPLSVDWSLRLVAETDGAADTDNFLGVCAEPSRANGVLSPPAAIDNFDFSFTGADSAGARTATSFVKTLGAGQQWQAEVTCTRPAAQIKLNWPDLSALPRDCRPVLRDVATGNCVYMRTSNGYNFTLNRGEIRRRFVIDISSKAGDLLAIRSLQTGSGGGRAQISYTLSAPAVVDIDILNLAGRAVRRLQSGTLSSGSCTAAWDGGTDSGSSAPAGTYLVRIAARTEDGQAINAVQALYLRK